MKPFPTRHHRTDPFPSLPHRAGPADHPVGPTLPIASAYRLSRQEARCIEQGFIDLHELIHAHLDRDRTWHVVQVPIRDDAGVPAAVDFGRATPTLAERIVPGVAIGFGLGLWLGVLYVIGARLW